MQCDINLDAIISDPARQKIFDIILEEACRQWCCFIDEAPERADGEGFAQFFYEIFEQKEQEYMEDLGIKRQQDKPAIRRDLEGKRAQVAAHPGSEQTAKGQEAAL